MGVNIPERTAIILIALIVERIADSGVDQPKVDALAARVFFEPFGIFKSFIARFVG